MPQFERDWTAAELTEEELRALEDELCQYPAAGPVIPGTGGLRKIRWALPGRGKSGGIRVVYVDFVCFEKIYFIAAYTKSEKGNLSKKECGEIKKLIAALEAVLKGEKQ